MKSKYFYIIIFTWFFCEVKAQEFPYQDTIRIELDNRLSATIAFSQYKVFIKKNSIFKDMGSLKVLLEKAKTEIPPYQNYKIEYYPDKSLVIKEGENKKVYRLKDNVFETCDYTYECNLFGEDYTMHIDFSQLKDLTNEELKAEMEKWEQSLRNEHFKKNILSTSLGTKIILNKDSLLKDSINVKFTLFPAPRKRAELSPGICIGAALIKNQPLNSLSVNYGLKFRKNGILLNEFYVTLRGFPTFNNNHIQKNLINSFGWKSNISHDNMKQNWIGIEYGYILKDEADFFENNTKVLGFIRQYGKLTVVPELYFQGFFKSGYPGLRIEFGF